MIFKHYLVVSGLVIASASSTYAASLPPSTNLDFLKQQIVAYHKSGAYDYDISSVANKALTTLQQYIKNNKLLASPQKLAMVLDIDETSLSNYYDLKQLDFGGTEKMHNDAENRADDPAIMPTLKLYRYALKEGVTVFFITGRTETIRRSTLKTS